MALKDIREFFWPLLDPPHRGRIETDYILEDINTEDSEELNFLLDLAQKRYQREDDRLKTVEQKASLFIGIMGIVTTVILTTMTQLSKEVAFDSFKILSFALLLIFFIYLIRTLSFSIKTLGRARYYVVDWNDIKTNIGEGYIKKYILLYFEMAEKNKIVINDKVNDMVLAQENFKRAIGTLLILILSVIGFCIYSHYVNCTIELSSVLRNGSWILSIIAIVFSLISK
ncbi:hypothetical protein K5X82_18030 [Halosquirtibacter xylanolyticus]|uniref:hypothetical protein n=1 Tax=Halosquirtibacter xylanolyticus TaxID=3374599 RepID=UPI0037478D32|nr:hypothetical protein K5X82_18030 [Prolixibacteraceae bacterium]